jgi:hypothetical protein
MVTVAVEIKLLPGDVELALLAGFVVPGLPLGHGARKRAAARLRARMAAVTVAVEMGAAATLCVVAQHAGSSERNFSRWFPVRGAMFAFPPPEFGNALGKVAANATSWQEIGLSIRPLLEALENNPEGRQFMADLAKLRREHPWIRSADGYFSEEIRSVIEANLHRAGGRALSLLGYFTEGVRAAFDEWSHDPSMSVMIVADAIDDLIKNFPRSEMRLASEEQQ